MFKYLGNGLALLAIAALASPIAAAGQASGIHIVAGEFGTLGAKRKLDIVARLQTLCGTDGDSCSVFCSETSFGRYWLGYRPICRVIYRCPDATTKSVEAAREEPIILSCRDPNEELSLQVAPEIEQLQPPAYIPPKSGN